MAIQAFEPKFMKVGVLTAALQELTPREVRDPDPDRAIEEWVEFARELGADYIQLSAALHPDRDRRPAGGDARSGGQHARPAPAVRQGARARGSSGRCRRTRSASPTSATSTTCCTTTRRSGRRSTTSCCASFDAAVLLGVDAVCGFVGRNQQHSMDQNLVDFEDMVHPAAEGGEGARADLPRRAVPDAGLDDGRQLAQQHRLHARRLDRAAPHLREARRRRPVPHPLRPVARDPDGAGHALDLPVPEGRGLRLPDRRLPRQGPGRSTPRASRPGATAARPWSAATGRTASRRRIRPTRSTRGRSRSCSASTSCRARRGTIRWRTCRTARWTGSITSSPRASC